MPLRKSLSLCVPLILLALAPAFGQSGPKTTPQQMRSYFAGVDKQVRSILSRSNCGFFC